MLLWYFEFAVLDNNRPAQSSRPFLVKYPHRNPNSYQK